MDLTKIKTLLSITDNSQDMTLAILLENAISTICVYLGIDSLPSELEFVAEELVIIRFNKLGVEHLSSEKIDVISSTFRTDDLAQFKTVLNKYKEQKLGNKRAKFL